VSRSRATRELTAALRSTAAHTARQPTGYSFNEYVYLGPVPAERTASWLEGDVMGLRRSLASAALITALAPVALLARPALAFAAPWPVYCAGPLPALVPPLDHGTLFNPDDHSDLLLGTPGLPGQAADGVPIPRAIAAGSGWHDFQLTATLPVQGVNSDLTDSPHDLKWIVFVSNSSASRVQYLNGGAWSDLGPWAGASTKLVTTAFDIDNSSQTATVRLRLRFEIDAGAPPGTAHLVEFGSYVDAEQSCTHFTFDTNVITVRASGSAPGSLRALLYAVAGAVVIAAGTAIVLVARRRKR
jgi:hypothetical protein